MSEPLLSSEEVASVLAGGGGLNAGAEPERHEAGSAAYSLRRAMAIAPEAEPEARRRLAELATALEQALRDELQGAIALELHGFQQERTGAAVDQLPQPAWILSLVAERGGGLALALDPTCALGMVELALGGAGNTAASGREATPLESRVMNKLCSALAGRLSRRGPATFARGLFRPDRVPAELAAPGQTVGVGLVRIKIGGAERNALLLATPDLLREAERPRSVAGRSLELGPLAPRLDRVTLETRVVLRAGLVSLADLVALAPGTVLRLEAGTSSLFDLRVNGRDLLKGTLARRDDGLVFEVKWRRGRRRTVRSGSAGG